MEGSTTRAWIHAIAVFVALAIASACTPASAAPSPEECASSWNRAVQQRQVRPQVESRRVLLSSQGPGDWNGEYPVCWLTVIEDERRCQAFHTRRDSGHSWDSEPVGSCDPAIYGENFVELEVSAAGHVSQFDAAE